MQSTEGCLRIPVTYALFNVPPRAEIPSTRETISKQKVRSRPFACALSFMYLV